MQASREQVEYMYQLIEAQRDFYLGATEQWKVNLILFMFFFFFICMHAHMITYLMVCILTGEGRRQPGPESQPEAADSCYVGG